MKRILVVDDDNELVEVVKLSLMTKGYQVQGISNVKGIHQYINDFLPDIILLDVYIGEHNGLDICKELSENPSTKHIKIIIFSGQGTMLDECHAMAFLRKPFSTEQLHFLIEKI
jgi:DNA-binding response OmpR family regulator